MDRYFCSPYEICMLEGIIMTLLSFFCIFIIIIINLINRNITNVDYISLLGLDNPFLYIIVMFVSFFYNISILVTCEKLSACHVLLTFIVNECYFYVSTKLEIFLNILGILLLIVILIIFLFFIEILEFNLFDISRNTIKNIGIRADRDNDYISESSEIDEADNNEPEGNQSLSNLLSYNTTQN